MSDSTGNSGKRPGRVENLTPWQKGQSGNLSGRPREEPGFRADCRKVAAELLEKIREADPTYTSGVGGGGTNLAGLVSAFEAIADRGGYLPVDKQTQVEIAQGRMVLAAMALQQLSAEQRQKLIEMWQGMFPSEKLPELDVPTDSNE